MKKINLFQSRRKIKYSFIVQIYDMKEEIKNTLRTLSSSYQNFPAEYYEVVLVQNPSKNNITEKDIDFFKDNLVFINNPSNIALTKSMNLAIAKSKGENIIICVDGARLLSPGILKYCNQALQLEKNSIVAFHGFHLGLFPQQRAITEGLYSKLDEKNFLKDINFPHNPNALFFKASWAESSSNGYLHQMAESNCLMVPRNLFQEVGGFDERLDSPSGGLANLDLYNRIIENENYRLYFVLGEGSFHQYHGGDTTNQPIGKFNQYKEEFKTKTGKDWAFPKRTNYEYLGHIPLESASLLKQSAVNTTVTLSTQRPKKIINNISEALSLPQPDQDYELVKILSMHRSKSSYLSRLIIQNTSAKIPGSNLGATFSSNAKGHFEPHEIVVLHNQIFAELNSSWRAVTPLDLYQRGADYFQYCVDRIDKVIRWGSQLNKDGSKDLSNSSALTFLIKDPRLCRLNLLWQQLDEQRNKKSKEIVLFDHPTKIADSLYKRDAIPHEWGELLWLRYSIDLLNTIDSDALILNLHNITEEALYKNISKYLDSQIIPHEKWIQNKPIEAKSEIAEIFETFCLNGNTSQLKNELKEVERFISNRTKLFTTLDKLMHGLI